MIKLAFQAEIGVRYWEELEVCVWERETEKGGAVAESVEPGTPGEEVPGSIPAVAARSLLVGIVSV